MSHTTSPHRNVDSGWNNHEIIRILTRNGKNTEFRHWNVMFIACATATAMSVQLVQKVGIEDMFILGSFRNDIGLGYSEAAYEAAKLRLFRKYDLIKMKPIRKENAKEMEMLATCWSRR